MIIGNNREKVIENIKIAAETGNFYDKVEIDDPVLTKEEGIAIVDGYLKNRNTAGFKFKSFVVRKAADFLTFVLNRDTEITGFEKLKCIEGGAFITSNHFSPIENTCIRKLTKKLGKKRINIISQITNFAMDGMVGYFMNYADTIPLAEDLHHTQKFISVLSELLAKNEYILIYPEQEMWFNYRKPRPPKRGAYYFAAKLNVPVICCFVEMQEKEEFDIENFHKIKFTVHVLDVLYPDPEKTVKENSKEMCERDYQLKKAAYEKAYGKELDYTFESTDIAGWTGDING